MDKKFYLVTGFFTLAILAISVFILSSSGSTKANLQKELGAKIEVDHKARKLNDIPYSKGVLLHAFPIKNTGNKELELANFSTSCMCTKVYLKKEEDKGPMFGMKGMSAPSDWVGVLKPGEKGEIVAAFDPAFHGPQGLGPVSRIVSFESNDPDNPYVELSFEGVVVK